MKYRINYSGPPRTFSSPDEIRTETQLWSSVHGRSWMKLAREFLQGWERITYRVREPEGHIFKNNDDWEDIPEAEAAMILFSCETRL